MDLYFSVPLDKKQNTVPKQFLTKNLGGRNVCGETYLGSHYRIDVNRVISVVWSDSSIPDTAAH